MIHTFKFEPKFEPGKDHATLGRIPVAGRIVTSKPVIEDTKAYWLIEIDDEPTNAQPSEHYQR